jgi:hypothetical protein
VCFTGWLMIPLSFGDLDDSCPDNTELINASSFIHCGIPCAFGDMGAFVLCGPFKPGEGAWIITVGMILAYDLPRHFAQ